MNGVVKEQILAIRNTGKANMLDASLVKLLAEQEGYYELVLYLEHHREAYGRFILTGKTDDDA